MEGPFEIVSFVREGGSEGIGIGPFGRGSRKRWRRKEKVQRIVTIVARGDEKRYRDGPPWPGPAGWEKASSAIDEIVSPPTFPSGQKATSSTTARSSC